MINLDIIPNNLEEALHELLLGLEDVEDFKNYKEDELTWKTHHGLGLWLRNNWALWEGSALAEYFGKLGINHPDDMTGIIIKSLWLKLNNQPIDLDRQIEYCKEYWQRQGYKNGIFRKEQTEEN